MRLVLVGIVIITGICWTLQGTIRTSFPIGAIGTAILAYGMVGVVFYGVRTGRINPEAWRRKEGG